MLRRDTKIKSAAAITKCLLLALALAICGCETTDQTAKDIIEKHNAYWGSTDEQGNTGWCSQTPIPPEELVIMKDCSNATPERTIEGAACE